MCTAVKEPPYQVSESGYGSFNLPVEVVFRNKEEPRKVVFEYDLLLPNLEDPPISQMRSECLTFQNPSEEFRQKLLRGGAKPIVGVGGGAAETPAKTGKKKPKPPADITEEPPKKKKKVEDKAKRGSTSSDSGSDSASDSEQEAPVVSKPKPKATTPWDTNTLKKLHKQLNAINDAGILQEIVNVIEQTGIYQLTPSTFDFDLCKLDESTLSKLSKLVE